MKTVKTNSTVKTASARKVRARKAPAKKASASLSSLTEKEQVKATRAQADKFTAEKEAGKRAIYCNMQKGAKYPGYGSSKMPAPIPSGNPMGAYTCAMLEALGYISISATGNVSATRKEIDRGELVSTLGSSMARHWINTTGRIEAGKLTAKGLNMLNARNKGESISKDGSATTCATKFDLVKLYRTWIKSGKGSGKVPFTAHKVMVNK